MRWAGTRVVALIAAAIVAALVMFLRRWDITGQRSSGVDLVGPSARGRDQRQQRRQSIGEVIRGAEGRLELLDIRIHGEMRSLPFLTAQLLEHLPRGDPITR